jgi:hypothetical protein
MSTIMRAFEPRLVLAGVLCSVLPLGATSAILAAQANSQGAQQTVVDRLFEKILDQGFVVTLTPLDEIKKRAELLASGEYGLTIDVTLKASPAARDALETAARELGGQSMDATLEVDVGMISLQARAVRISDDPKILEYFQRRIRSLVFTAELVLQNGESYACSTGDPWRLPITTVGQIYTLGGKAQIAMLGLSPAFDRNDYGFVAVRNGSISFKYRAVLSEKDYKQLTKLEGKVTESKGPIREGECLKVEKTAAQSN